MEIVYQLGETRLNKYEQDYIDEKMKKVMRLLTRNKGSEKKINVEIEQDKHSFWNISVTARIPRKVFRVKKSGNKLLGVVDIAEGALSEQIRRENEKVKNLIRKRKIKR